MKIEIDEETRRKLEAIVQRVADSYYWRVRQSDTLIQMKQALREAQQLTMKFLSRKRAKVLRQPVREKIESCRAAGKSTSKK